MPSHCRISQFTSILINRALFAWPILAPATTVGSPSGRSVALLAMAAVSFSIMTSLIPVGWHWRGNQPPCVTEAGWRGASSDFLLTAAYRPSKRCRSVSDRQSLLSEVAP